MGKMKYLFASLLLLIWMYGTAQEGIGIGTLTPHSSAILDVYAPNRDKGLLIPSVLRGQVANPANGLIVFDSTANPFGTGDLYVRAGNRWQPVFPRGGIIMWNGVTIPEGWALCDGSQGTPDLRGRFIVGLHPGDANYISEGIIGGAATVALTTANLASHSHSINSAGSHSHTVNGGSHNHSYSDDLAFETPPAGVLEGPYASSNTHGNGGRNIRYGRRVTKNTGSTTHTHTVSSNGSHAHTSNGTGSGTAHENRPPYYVLAYIMKL